MTDSTMGLQGAQLPGTGGAGPMAAGPTASAGTAELPALKYLRETRNATVFIAVVVALVCLLALIGTIVVGVQVSRLDSTLNTGVGSFSATCMSQGSNDPTC